MQPSDKTYPANRATTPVRMCSGRLGSESFRLRPASGHVLILGMDSRSIAGIAGPGGLQTLERTQGAMKSVTRSISLEQEGLP